MPDKIGAAARWIALHWVQIVSGAAALLWIAVLLRSALEWRRTPPKQREAAREEIRNEKRDPGDW